MTDHKKLVEALRKVDAKTSCDMCVLESRNEECAYDEGGGGCLYSDAADAIVALGLDNEDYEHENRRLHGEIEALQAENPIVETVLVDKLRQRIEELEEKQTYCDAYGDKWMTSGKDVPTEAYKHGYADGRRDAIDRMEEILKERCNFESENATTTELVYRAFMDGYLCGKEGKEIWFGGTRLE